MLKPDVVANLSTQEAEAGELPQIKGQTGVPIYLDEYTVAVFRHTRRGHQTPFIDGCELPCGCWELNSGPVEEQSVLLAATQWLRTYWLFL